MYIEKLTNIGKLACLSLDNFYPMAKSFIGPMFRSWTTIINILDTKLFLKFDEKGVLCITLHGYMVYFYYISKMDQIAKEIPMSRDQFDNIVIS